MHDDFNVALYDMDKIVDILAQYYEAAGFSDYHNQVLSKMTEEALFEHFMETFRPSDTSQGTNAPGDEEDFNRLLDEVRR